MSAAGTLFFRDYANPFSPETEARYLGERRMHLRLRTRCRIAGERADALAAAYRFPPLRFNGLLRPRFQFPRQNFEVYRGARGVSVSKISRRPEEAQISTSAKIGRDLSEDGG